MNNTPPKKRRFNVIDAVILAAAALGIAFGAHFFTHRDTTRQGAVTVDYTMRLTGVNALDTAIPKVGDILLATDGKTLGSVIAIEQKRAAVQAFSPQTDRFYETTLDGRIDIYITAEVSCETENGRYAADGHVISANAPLAVALPLERDSLLITEVHKKEETHEEEAH